MGDNGGPHIDNDPAPSRWDPTYIERNWPYRGQKHEIFEGGYLLLRLISRRLDFDYSFAAFLGHNATKKPPKTKHTPCTAYGTYIP